MISVFIFANLHLFLFSKFSLHSLRSRYIRHIYINEQLSLFLGFITGLLHWVLSSRLLPWKTNGELCMYVDM